MTILLTVIALGALGAERNRTIRTGIAASAYSKRERRASKDWRACWVMSAIEVTATSVGMKLEYDFTVSIAYLRGAIQPWNMFRE